MEVVGRDPKLCQGVVGYDTYALYLWSIMQEMPTGHYARRRLRPGFAKNTNTPPKKPWSGWRGTFCEGSSYNTRPMGVV